MKVGEKRVYTSFVAEGGGVCGIAYTGAVRALQEAGVLKTLRNFAGTSAGAIVAAALSCGATAEYMDEKLGTVDFNDFLDNSWGILRDLYRLITKHGWNRGDVFLKWFGQIMKDLTGDSDTTFSQAFQMYNTTLVLVAWNNSTRQPIYFTRKTYPDMPIKDAVRMSMSVPLLFKSKWLEIDGKKCEIIDGGIGNNYPLSTFDFKEYCTATTPQITDSEPETDGECDTKFINWETIGFRVDNKDDFDFEQNKWTDTTGLKDSIQSIVTSIYILSQKVSESPTDKKRTVRIDCGTVFPFDFSIDLDTRKKLIEAGYIATKAYL